MGKKKRNILRVLFAVGVAVKVIAIYGVILSALCVVNGNRFGMLLPFGIGVALWVAADELVDATERRMK